MSLFFDFTGTPFPFFFPAVSHILRAPNRSPLLLPPPPQNAALGRGGGGGGGGGGGARWKGPFSLKTGGGKDAGTVSFNAGDRLPGEERRRGSLRRRRGRRCSRKSNDDDDAQLPKEEVEGELEGERKNGGKDVDDHDGEGGERYLEEEERRKEAEEEEKEVLYFGERRKKVKG